MQGRAVTYDELVPDYEFHPVLCELEAAGVSKYVQAIESTESGLVPPLAVTARALKAMMGAFTLPADAIAIHTSQELELFKPVPVGATIECKTKVARKLTRGKMRMLVLQTDVYDDSSELVQSGKTTVVLPS